MNSPHCSTSLWRPQEGITIVSEDEWTALARQADIPESVIERSRERDRRARLVFCDAALLVTLRVWSGLTGSTADDLEDVTREWDIFLGSDFALIRSDTALPPLPPSTLTPSQLLYALLDESIDSCYPAMDVMDAEIDALELAVYTPESNIELPSALRLKKQLLLLRQTITPLRDVINQLLRAQHTAIDPSLMPSLQDIFDRSLRLTEQIDLHREILSGVFEAQVGAVQEATGKTFPFPKELATYRIGETEHPFRDYIRMDWAGDTDAAIAHILDTIYRRVYAYIERGH